MIKSIRFRLKLTPEKKNAGELPPDPASDACDQVSPRGDYRENFLYLIRCGIVESVPRRRFLSSS